MDLAMIRLIIHHGLKDMMKVERVMVSMTTLIKDPVHATLSKC